MQAFPDLRHRRIATTIPHLPVMADASASRSLTSPPHENPTMNQRNTLMETVRKHLLADEVSRAIPLLEQVIAHAPDDAQAWGLLGRCLRLDGVPDRAESALRRSIELLPTLRASQVELAIVLRDAGHLPEACTLLEAVLAAEPQNLIALVELATIDERDNPQRAARHLLTAARMRPQDADLVFRAGVALQRVGQLDFAAQAFAQIARLRPHYPDGWLGQGRCLLHMGQPDAARDAFTQALRIAPDNTDAMLGLYDSQPPTPSGDAERLRLMQRVCELAPSAQRYVDLAGTFHNLGRTAECRAMLEQALTLDPDYAPARWQHFQLPQSPSPDSPAAAQDFIAQWREGLSYFEARAAATRPIDEIEPRLSRTPAYASAFLRHYLPGADADQPRYGRLLRALVAPDHPDAPPPPSRERPRIAIVSAHLHWHTVSRLFVPLLERLDTRCMDIELLCIGALDDGWKARLENNGIRIHAQRRPPPTWADLLRTLQPDLVLYLEIGMEANTHWLAAQRLAPVQAMMWGHPVSSGLPSIDLCFSPEAMEPQGAQTLYTERLELLPGFGHGFTPDAMHDASPAGGFDENRIDLLCTQSIYKLMPDQDALFARILAALPGARLHLIPHEQEAIRERLRQRMAPVMRAHGADPDTQLVMHPLLGFDQWLALAARCRLHLDSLHFSGGMTSFDLCAIGLPPITLPDATLRSRQTAAMMQALDLPELIARDADDYVEKAIALASDPTRCRALAATIRERSGRLWNPDGVAAGLNRLLLSALER